MKKLGNTIYFQNLSETPSPNRLTTDALLIFHLIKKFELRIFLELGVCLGETLGIMVDACENGLFEGVDINPSLDNFNKLYKEFLPNITIHIQNTNTLTITKKYDFINVDGDHSFQWAWHDLKKILPGLHKNTILMVDDYNIPGVHEALEKFLKLPHDFIPFIRTDQCIFLHHRSSNCVDFLDIYIEEVFGDFCDLFNEDYLGYTVKTVRTKKVITKHPLVFKEICKVLDL